MHLDLSFALIKHLDLSKLPILIKLSSLVSNCPTGSNHILKCVLKINSSQSHWYKKYTEVLMQNWDNLGKSRVLDFIQTYDMKIHINYIFPSSFFHGFLACSVHHNSLKVCVPKIGIYLHAKKLGHCVGFRSIIIMKGSVVHQLLGSVAFDPWLTHFSRPIPIKKEMHTIIWL